MAIRIASIEKRENYIMVRVNGSRDELRNANRWCTQTECGKQVNIHSFSFKREEELTMFKLKWEHNNT